MEDEEDTFWLLLTFMEMFDVESFYFEGLNKLQLSLAQLDKHISVAAPHLSQHFKKCNIDAMAYATPFYLTYFTYNVSMEASARIFDVMFLVVNCIEHGKGEDFVHRLALSILQNLAPSLLAQDSFEGCVVQLKNLPLDRYNFYDVCSSAVKMDVAQLNRMRQALENRASTPSAALAKKFDKK